MASKFSYQRDSEISSFKGNIFYEFVEWESTEVLSKLFTMNIINNTENMLRNDGTNILHKIVVAAFANLTDLIDFAERYSNASIHFSKLRNELDAESLLHTIENSNKHYSNFSIINSIGKRDEKLYVAMITFND